jgi:hypothetical protein
LGKKDKVSDEQCKFGDLIVQVSDFSFCGGHIRIFFFKKLGSREPMPMWRVSALTLVFLLYKEESDSSINIAGSYCMYEVLVEGIWIK